MLDFGGPVALEQAFFLVGPTSRFSNHYSFVFLMTCDRLFILGPRWGIYVSDTQEIGTDSILGSNSLLKINICAIYINFLLLPTCYSFSFSLAFGTFLCQILAQNSVINVDSRHPRWSSGGVLISGLGFNPDQRGDGFLWALKILKHSFLRRGSKAVGPMS
jgi:hypothetical protein